MIDQNTALWAFSIAALIWIFWVDLRLPIVRQIGVWLGFDKELQHNRQVMFENTAKERLELGKEIIATIHRGPGRFKTLNKLNKHLLKLHDKSGVFLSDGELKVYMNSLDSCLTAGWFAINKTDEAGLSKLESELLAHQYRIHADLAGQFAVFWLNGENPSPEDFYKLDEAAMAARSEAVEIADAKMRTTFGEPEDQEKPLEIRAGDASSSLNPMQNLKPRA